VVVTDTFVDVYTQAIHEIGYKYSSKSDRNY